MDEHWLAQVDADPADRAREIAHAHAAFIAGASPSPGAGPGIRPVVTQSWRRSAQAGVDPDTDPPVVLTGVDLRAYRDAHPLAAAIAVLRELVGGAADDGEHLMAVSDAAGRLLWVEGHREARRRAEGMGFVEGAAWDEAHAGTNAPGTALALDHAVQIFATEHFRHDVQAWTCAAAPIRDPASGRVLGVIDVTGGDTVAHPHSLALVRAAAVAAEGLLGQAVGLWVPRARPAADRLAVLGRAEGALRLDGTAVRLNRRHSEILVLLAVHPEGRSGDQLATGLYGDDDAGPAAVRVELTRLRRLTGDLVASRPYRLTRPLVADFLEVGAALRRGDLGSALAAYAGPLLPSSEAPGVVEQRRWLELGLRAAVLADARPELLFDFAERCGFDDLELWERLAAILPAASPHAAVAQARVAELRVEYGVA